MVEGRNLFERETMSQSETQVQLERGWKLGGNRDWEDIEIMEKAKMMQAESLLSLILRGKTTLPRTCSLGIRGATRIDLDKPQV